MEVFKGRDSILLNVQPRKIFGGREISVIAYPRIYLRFSGCSLILFFFLAVPRSLGDLSSLTRDPAQHPSGESSKFQPLDCQGIPECPLGVYTCHQGNSGHQFNFIEFPVNAFLFLPFFFIRSLLTYSCAVVYLVAQLCPTLCDPMDCSPRSSSIHGDSPDKNIGVGCHPSSSGSSQPGDRTQVFRIVGGFFTV